ncbi:conserved exported protein of unknown function [Rhodovastum atsumiense]|uniref:FlgO domain-containing protein n=1 Tax=Rhodovastum atsumiense TaxID=504468 RepID=A0A5M6IV80_9PROT|nr:hypothetical protein [Rhodovastum atsumiense]KAA5611458.1 hypothetical protein F1189_14080 [Rhodovastum atsumiense]CAH2601144.1 conserved exported protein of unknown function [Rhodovastum atsumiense]
MSSFRSVLAGGFLLLAAAILTVGGEAPAAGAVADAVRDRLREEAQRAGYVTQAALQGDMKPIAFASSLRPLLTSGIFVASSITFVVCDDGPSGLDIARALQDRLQEEARQTAHLMRNILRRDVPPIRFANIHPGNFSDSGLMTFAGQVSFDEVSGTDVRHVTTRVVVSRDEESWRVLRMEKI